MRRRRKQYLILQLVGGSRVPNTSHRGRIRSRWDHHRRAKQSRGLLSCPAFYGEHSQKHIHLLHSIDNSADCSSQQEEEGMKFLNNEQTATNNNKNKNKKRKTPTTTKRTTNNATEQQRTTAANSKINSSNGNNSSSRTTDRRTDDGVHRCG